MAGDDVPEKKPDPSIYVIAAKRLSVDPTECLVVEDSTIGLRVCSTPSSSSLPCACALLHLTSQHGISRAPRQCNEVQRRLAGSQSAVC